MTRFELKPSPTFAAALQALSELLINDSLPAIERVVVDVTWAPRLRRLLGQAGPERPTRSCDSLPSFMWSPHASEWQQDSHTVSSLSQSSELAYDDLQSIMAFCGQQGLRVAVSVPAVSRRRTRRYAAAARQATAGETAWHFPGHSPVVYAVEPRVQPRPLAQRIPDADLLQRLMTAWLELVSEQRDRIITVFNEFVADTGSL